MPIYRDDTGIPVIHLGHGDVLIGTARLPEEELFFAPAPFARTVGEVLDVDEEVFTTAALQAAVRVFFETEAALDVLLERLGVLKRSFELARHVP